SARWAVCGALSERALSRAPGGLFAGCLHVVASSCATSARPPNSSPRALRCRLREARSMDRETMRKDEAGLHIAMFSVHGLIRGSDLELGRDADTGGQTKYVVELARALGRHPRVSRVDLVTRRIDDLEVSDDYAKPVERLGERAALVRVPAGGDEYMRKEELWPHLD